LLKLDIGQRQAMVARMREYTQFLDHPASAKLYKWPNKKRGPQGQKYSHPAQQQLDFVVGNDP
jgi:hypothetical protein